MQSDSRGHIQSSANARLELPDATGRHLPSLPLTVEGVPNIQGNHSNKCPSAVWLDPCPQPVKQTKGSGRSIKYFTAYRHTSTWYSWIAHKVSKVAGLTLEL
jgi:hypothetical protein